MHTRITPITPTDLAAFARIANTEGISEADGEAFVGLIVEVLGRSRSSYQDSKTFLDACPRSIAGSHRIQLARNEEADLLKDEVRKFSNYYNLIFGVMYVGISEDCDSHGLSSNDPAYKVLRKALSEYLKIIGHKYPEVDINSSEISSSELIKSGNIVEDQKPFVKVQLEVRKLRDIKGHRTSENNNFDTRIFSHLDELSAWEKRWLDCDIIEPILRKYKD